MSSVLQWSQKSCVQAPKQYDASLSYCREIMRNLHKGNIRSFAKGMPRASTDATVKKRGRKPREKAYSLHTPEDTVRQEDQENIILHLPISSEEALKAIALEEHVLDYDPESMLRELTPYAPDLNVGSYLEKREAPKAYVNEYHDKNTTESSETYLSIYMATNCQCRQMYIVGGAAMGLQISHVASLFVVLTMCFMFKVSSAHLHAHAHIL